MKIASISCITRKNMVHGENSIFFELLHSHVHFAVYGGFFAPEAAFRAVSNDCSIRLLFKHRRTLISVLAQQLISKREECFRLIGLFSFTIPWIFDVKMRLHWVAPSVHLIRHIALRSRRRTSRMFFLGPMLSDGNAPKYGLRTFS